MRAALIGHGMVAATHVAAIQSSETVELAGILGRDSSRAREFAARFENPPPVFETLGQIASDPRVDFAIVTTPPNARVEIVEALARAGKPILLEKPVERTCRAAIAVVDICESAGVPLGVVFQHRAREASVALKQRIGSGALGAPQTVEIRVPWWRDQSYYDAPGRGSYARDGGGVMISQAIHTLDLALWLAGPVTSLQAMMHRSGLHRLEAEDWAGALLSFRNGAVGTLVATTASFPGEPESIRIQGSKAAALLEAGTLQWTPFEGDSETLGADTATGSGADPMAFTHEWHQHVIEDFARAIASGRPPLCPGREALAAHAVIDTMERAGRSGRIEEVPAV